MMETNGYKKAFWSAKGVAEEQWDWEAVALEARYRPAKMAVLCGVSERHLQRVFKRHLHCTPGQWLRQLQCRRAKELIVRGYSSKAAALEVAFATESHFCREFKKIYGAPPQSFAPGFMSAVGQKMGPARNLSDYFGADFAVG